MEDGEVENSWVRRVREEGGHATYTTRAIEIRTKYGMDGGSPVFPPDFELGFHTPTPFAACLGISTPGPHFDWRGLEPHKIALILDLKKPFDELMKNVEDWVRLRVKSLKARGVITEPKRRQLNLYDAYLKIWDLHTREGLSLGQIARKIDQPENTVKSQYHTANDLIMGGYKAL